MWTFTGMLSPEGQTDKSMWLLKSTRSISILRLLRQKWEIIGNLELGETELKLLMKNIWCLKYANAIRFHVGCTFRYVTSLWPVLWMPCSNSTIPQHFAEGSLGQQTSKMAIFLVQFSLVNASLCLHLRCSAHRDGGLTAYIFLECFKQALIIPEDKKTWLQPSNSDCYFTISNPLVASQENGCSFPNRFYLFIYLRKLQSYFKYISICNKFFREYIQNVLEDFMETDWGKVLEHHLKPSG